jgi:hypothetical protein
MVLERGIPAISAVMGSKRLPFPSKSFDLVRCARCRVPWHTDGAGTLHDLAVLYLLARVDPKTGNWWR